MNDLDLHFALPTVPNRNEWKLCQFLHVVNYMPIIIYMYPNNFSAAGDPRPYWSACNGKTKWLSSLSAVYKHRWYTFSYVN